MHDKPLESDWKTFRRMVPELRERYLDGRNTELARILEDEKLSPTERFWALDERAGEIAKVLLQCLDGHSRSKMRLFMILMVRHGMMAERDLEEFSEELRENVLRAASC